MFDQLTNKEAMGFIDKVAEPFKSLPHLPKGLVEFLVKIAPWFALLDAVLLIITGPIIGLLGTIGSLLSLSPFYLITTIATVVLIIVDAVLLFMAFGPLKNRQTKGWVLLFWANIIGIAEAIVNVFVSGGAGVVGSIIGILIGLYILFEMRSSYSGEVK